MSLILQEKVQVGSRVPRNHGGAMAQIRPKGAPIQFSDPPFSTDNIVRIELTDHVPQTPHDSPLSGDHTPRSDEDSIKLKELTDLRHSLGRRNVSKQRRKNLKSQQKFHDVDDLVDEEVIVEDKGSGEKEGSTAETISTAGPDVSAARPEVSTATPKTPPTTTLFDDEDVTIADTLEKMKS
nr:hypothetical protein [Tanacetum cinerariifolium]